VIRTCEYSEAKGFDIIDCGNPASNEHTTNTQYELFDGVLRKETYPDHFWLCEEHHLRGLRPDSEWEKELLHDELNAAREMLSDLGVEQL
jgi:hypothetical protein